eukprot:GAFH01004462.1.p6 GENE.GAFH01004462.1~~GAFH01004462.1.p6  ORF type:complete len:50 (+),score=0.80 GAFH01004462.1:152-301(+)
MLSGDVVCTIRHVQLIRNGTWLLFDAEPWVFPRSSTAGLVLPLGVEGGW